MILGHRFFNSGSIFNYDAACLRELGIPIAPEYSAFGVCLSSSLLFKGQVEATGSTIANPKYRSPWWQTNETVIKATQQYLLEN